MIIQESYVWKELTYDGRLIEPKAIGPYFDKESLNSFVGEHNSKLSAMVQLKRLQAKTNYGFGNLTLVTIYRAVSEQSVAADT